MPVGADGVLSRRYAADARDLFGDLARGQYAALARLGALRQFDFEGFHHLRQFLDLVRREIALEITHAVFGRTHLHDDVASAREVMRRQSAFAGVHPATGLLRTHR